MSSEHFVECRGYDGCEQDWAVWRALPDSVALWDACDKVLPLPPLAREPPAAPTMPAFLMVAPPLLFPPQLELPHPSDNQFPH